MRTMIIAVIMTATFPVFGQIRQFETTKTNEWKFGLGVQISPFRTSQTTFGGSLDLYRFSTLENRKVNLYLSLFLEGGKTENSGYDDELERSDFHIGGRFGFGVGKLVLYGLVESHQWNAEKVLSLEEQSYSSFAFGAGAKGFLGPTKRTTAGLEVSTDRTATFIFGFLF